jgi:hypothetical protein
MSDHFKINDGPVAPVCYCSPALLKPDDEDEREGWEARVKSAPNAVFSVPLYAHPPAQEQPAPAVQQGLRAAAIQALVALDNATDAQSNPQRRDFPTIHDFGQMRRAGDALRAALATHPAPP